VSAVLSNDVLEKDARGIELYELEDVSALLLGKDIEGDIRVYELHGLDHEELWECKINVCCLRVLYRVVII